MLDLLAPLAAVVPRKMLGGVSPVPSFSLNELVAAHGIATGDGKTLRFVSPGGSTLAYEERAWLHGEVETRADNWHDAFNALVWLAYPQAKAALNRKHYRTMTERRALGCRDRGRLRDALTQFDECGLVVACADMTLWAGISAHRWREVFADRRGEVAAKMRFFLFGHASMESLRVPFVGLTAKALCMVVDAAWLEQPLAAQLATVDAWLAARIDATDETFRSSFQPLPLLGIPGVTPDSEQPAYYDDIRQFRPKRLQCDPEVRQAAAASQDGEESPGPIEQDAG
ncbi:hypothetical protein DFR35_2805 [Sulfurisoma sediminicola]|uniref:DUF3025 family protein n=1 Tax=Sulfurisoma sediminicola TaxID=1381557 RepID=A0A497X8V7_9PROT|nr:hypothetical protein DFR35_2805 [Sulfurisoma sediminicola]